MANPLEPWKETPLDHWSTEIDPGIMSGDEWVSHEDTADTNYAPDPSNQDVHAPFMHPTHDTSYPRSSPDV